MTETQEGFGGRVQFYTEGTPPGTELYGPDKLYQKDVLTKAWRANVPFKIQTPEGEFDEQPAGTFIALDANGGVYPIAADVMEKTYRQVSGGGGRKRNLTTYSDEELVAELEERGGLFIQLLDDETLIKSLENRGYVVNVR